MQILRKILAYTIHSSWSTIISRLSEVRDYRKYVELCFVVFASNTYIDKEM